MRIIPLTFKILNIQAGCQVMMMMCYGVRTRRLITSLILTDHQEITAQEEPITLDTQLGTIKQHHMFHHQNIKIIVELPII